MQKDSFVAPDITEGIFDRMKNKPSQFTDWMLGYAGFQLSFGAMWFGSYRRDNTGKRNYSDEAMNNINKQAKKIKGIQFYNSPYSELPIPKNSILYCDPPYKGTAKYKENKEEFDHDRFWQWCREKTKAGHKVFISEYNAPSDFICVWQKEIQSGLNTNTTKKGVEKLFVHKSLVESDYENLY